MGSVAGQPLWDMSYEDQKQTISNMKETIEACTNTPIKIISSPYMASDMTTLAVAQELGIPYITARGTTDTKASVYQVEGYTTKILSVSNIPKVQFKYGSLCDFSYYQRAGSPEDMLAELMRAIEPLTTKEQARYGSSHKVTPVTHTNIGGYLQPWTEMWLNFWDSTTDKIDWISLDAFMSKVDWTLPDWQVPINKNAPYTPEKIRPATPYEEVEKVQNPCQVEDIGSKTEELTNNGQVDQEVSQKNELVMFHNAKGPMCLAALDFFSEYGIEYTQHLDTEENYSQLLDSYRQNYPNSEGESGDYQYFPIIFYEGKVYSGFNEKIQNEILNNWQTAN